MGCKSWGFRVKVGEDYGVCFRVAEFEHYSLNVEERGGELDDLG